MGEYLYEHFQVSGSVTSPAAGAGLTFQGGYLSWSAGLGGSERQLRGLAQGSDLSSPGNYLGLDGGLVSGGPQQIGNLAVTGCYGDDVALCLVGGNKSTRGAYGGVLIGTGAGASVSALTTVGGRQVVSGSEGTDISNALGMAFGGPNASDMTPGEKSSAAMGFLDMSGVGMTMSAVNALGSLFGG
jgi:hypothetical protein